MAEGLGHKKMEKRQSQHLILRTFSELGDPFPLLELELENCSWSINLCTDVASSLGQHLHPAWGSWLINSSLAPWYFEFWSSSLTHLLLITPQNPPVTAPRIPASSIAAVSGEQGGGSLVFPTLDMEWGMGFVFFLTTLGMYYQIAFQNDYFEMTAYSP